MITGLIIIIAILIVIIAILGIFIWSMGNAINLFGQMAKGALDSK